MNVPYVKKYDKNGNVSNPINEVYLSKFDNRKARRSFKNEIPFKGNTGHINLTVIKESKFIRFIQSILDLKNHRIKRIKHYLPA